MLFTTVKDENEKKEERKKEKKFFIIHKFSWQSFKKKIILQSFIHKKKVSYV